MGIRRVLILCTKGNNTAEASDTPEDTSSTLVPYLKLGKKKKDRGGSGMT